MSTSLLEQLKELFEVLEQLYRGPDEDRWQEVKSRLRGLRFELDKITHFVVNKDFELARARAVRLLDIVLLLNHTLGNDLEKALAVVVRDKSSLFDRTREEADKTIADTKESYKDGVTHIDPKTLEQVALNVTDEMFVVEEVEIDGSTYFFTKFRKVPDGPALTLISHKYVASPTLDFPADEYVFREMVTRLQIINGEEGKELITTSALRVHSVLGDEGFEIVREREINKLEKRLNGLLANADCRELSRASLEEILDRRLSEEDIKSLTATESEAMYLERISRRMAEGTTTFIEAVAKQAGARMEKVDVPREEDDPTV